MSADHHGIDISIAGIQHPAWTKPLALHERTGAHSTMVSCKLAIPSKARGHHARIDRRAQMPF